MRTARLAVPYLVPLVLFLAPLPTDAQDADLATRANAAVQSGDWESAAELFGELTTAQPENANAWFQLGRATIESGGDTSAGRAALDKAVELGFPAAPAMLSTAKSHLRDEAPAAAIDTLERLAEQGPAPFVVAQLRTDEAFAALANDAAYQAAVKRLTPCTSDEYRQFDFWLGSWKVFTPQGQQVGTNVVTEALDGCALIENWTSVSGGKGMSINYYDRDQGTWTQIYRDSSGNIAQWPTLVGGLEDGAMVLDSGPETNPRSRWRWSLEEDGRVRQMAESTTDGGETWTVVWDSYYQKVDD